MTPEERVSTWWFTNTKHREEMLRLYRVEEIAQVVSDGLTLGEGQQVYITGDHFFFTTEALRNALEDKRA